MLNAKNKLIMIISWLLLTSPAFAQGIILTSPAFVQGINTVNTSSARETIQDLLSEGDLLGLLNLRIETEPGVYIYRSKVRSGGAPFALAKLHPYDLVRIEAINALLQRVPGELPPKANNAFLEVYKSQLVAAREHQSNLHGSETPISQGLFFDIERVDAYKGEIEQLEGTLVFGLTCISTPGVYGLPCSARRLSTGDKILIGIGSLPPEVLETLTGTFLYADVREGRASDVCAGCDAASGRVSR